MAPLVASGISPHSALRQEASTTALFTLYFGQRTWAGLSSHRWVAFQASFGQHLWDGGCGAAQLCLWNLSLLEQSVLLG